MTNYDFCVAWNWEYDADFIALLEKACQNQKISLLQITQVNSEKILNSLENNQINFRIFLDRASDSDDRFIPIGKWAKNHQVCLINSYEFASRAWDKALIHEILEKAGIAVPRIIILPPYNEKPNLSDLNLNSLGQRFNIKPAHGGGSEDIVLQATTMEEVVLNRQKNPNDKYLLQSYITPIQLDYSPAWFRIIYCAGEIYPCWHNIYTRIYTPITSEEENRYQLQPLKTITSAIAEISKMDLFSTEIALTSENKFIVIDYLNDPIDLRLQSKTLDGIPDNIVSDIVKRLIMFVK